MDKLLNEFSVGLFFWQILLFVALLLLLKKFAWKPILDTVNEREENIKNALEGAERAKQEMLNLQADNEKILKEARIERDSLLKEAREIKDNIISQAKEEAQIQANKLMEQTKAAIENEKAKAISDIKKQMGELSVSIAEKVVKNELSDKDKQLKLVDQLLNEVTLN
jgi:F-type H+-transporting ATPase subunit b